MKTNKKKKSLVLLVVSVIAIFSLALAGFKGFEVAGWQYKSFDDVLTKGLDLQGGVSVLMEIKADEVTSEDLEKTKQLLALRVNKVGVAETVVTTEGEKRIRVDIPGAFDSSEIVSSLSKSGNLTFIDPNGNVVLTGADVKNASSGLDQNAKPIVNLELTEEGRTKFANATKEFLNQKITIKLDDEEISAPTVQSTITDGRAQISGSKTADEAKSTAALINAGALPVPVEAVEISNVGAQLGAEALPNALKAGAVGLVLIFLFMIIYYKIPGVIASIVLTLYITLTLMVFAESGVTLTLPGIAGLLLTIGMAVDANVLIFERIKEELRLGASMKSAVKSGFENAHSAIIDSNVTTILVGLVLYFMGTGAVKGFAVTLMVGIVMSMFTALVITKFLMKLSVEAGILKGMGTIKNNSEKMKIKIIERSKIWFAISGVLIVIGLGFMFTKGLDFGIDFTGGTRVVVELGADFNKEEVDGVVKGIVSDAVTNTIDDTQYEIKSQDLDSAKVDELFKELQEKYSLEDEAKLSESQIGASIGEELTKGSILALGVAFICMLIYIAFRFEFSFGVSSLIALAHDILITLSVFAIFSITINTPFIASILTIVGYSINATIVIFDRIRENKKLSKTIDVAELADKSVNQTLARSINTSLTTLFVIGSVYIFVPTVREFSLPLLIGVIVGAYSSIFIASPVWVAIKKRTKSKKA
ncbi:MAG: protein translocase subunit SecD [Clostridium sp.]